MTESEARKKGFNTGLAIGQENRPDFTDRDKFINACLEHESGAFRQFSPFEFLAHEFNSADDPETLWDAYDSGVFGGVIAAW